MTWLGRLQGLSRVRLPASGGLLLQVRRVAPGRGQAVQLGALGEFLLAGAKIAAAPPQAFSAVSCRARP